MRHGCEVKESQECDIRTAYLDEFGWVCEPCYYTLKNV